MKNAVLGIVCSLILIYTLVLSLSAYSVCIRKNQMEKTISSVLMSAMNKYYKPNMYSMDKLSIDDMQVEKEIIENIELQLDSASQLEAVVYVCDMQKGIISAKVKESFKLPMGQVKELTCSKVIIADQPMEES